MSQPENQVEEYCGFSDYDKVFLRVLIRNFESKRCAEIGSFIGNGSTQVFIEEKVELVCVDTWRGTVCDEWMTMAAKEVDVFSHFRNNVGDSLGKEVVAIMGESVRVAGFLPDGLFDLVFIDAGHDYRSALNDINAWLPKVKTNGILCGHDCEGRPGDFQEFIDGESSFRHIAKEYDAIVNPTPNPKTSHIHPGVILAVDEIFGGQAKLPIEKVPYTIDSGQKGYATIWWHRT